MKSKVGLCAALALACGAGGSANAGTILFDGFESYGAASQTNFNGFNQLEVVNGTVDYVREPDFGLTTPTGVGLVDLDGSTSNGGRLQSKEVFAPRQTFVLEFDARGNARGGPADFLTFGFDATVPAMTRMRVLLPNSKVLNIAGPTYTVSLASNQGWGHYRLALRNISNDDFSARAFLETSSNDSVGPLIDNVCVAVPEPATWALMIGGFGLAGATLRNRRVQSA